MKTLITDIQRFSLNDGPGIRTTVFFKGCNMRCGWCHNPETLDMNPVLMFARDKCIGCGKCFEVCPAGAHKVVEGAHVIDRDICVRCGRCTEVCYAEALQMCGREMTVDEIMSEILQDKPYYDASGGGVTLSGGEILCHVPFAVELAKACRKEGIAVAIESNLSFPYESIRPLLEVVDVVMADIKIFDDDLHKAHTGISNRHVLENVKKIDDKPLIIRTPLIPDVTATKENLRAIAAFLCEKENLIYYQILNFNPLGGSKYAELDAKNAFFGKKAYTDGQMAEFASWLSDININLKVGE